MSLRRQFRNLSLFAVLFFLQFASVLRVFSSFGSPPVRHERFSGSRFFSFPFFF
jgi:hypothetical protein